LAVSGAAAAVLVIVAAFYLVKNLTEKTPVAPNDSVAKTTEVIAKIDKINLNTNQVLSSEQTEAYLDETTELLQVTSDISVKADLYELQFKLYANSGDTENATVACETGLALNATPLHDYHFNMHLFAIYEKAENKDKMITALEGMLEYSGDGESAAIDREYVETRYKELVNE
jgi:hypothetical protein